MTRDEAKSVLFDMLGKGIYVKDTKENQAILAALRALEQEPCEDWYDVPSDEMTLEQARQAVRDLRKMWAEHLEQEPCGKGINVFTTDAISRQEAIVQLSHNKTGDDDCDVIIQRDIETIKALPPVTAQSKIGHWLLSGGYWRCSECKEKALLKLDKAKGGCREYIPVKSNFCPNCGTKMQEVEE